MNSSIDSDGTDWKSLALNIVHESQDNFSLGYDNPGSVVSLDQGGFDGVTDMYSKLEGMMSAVRQEVEGLENMKSKLKEVGKLKEKLNVTRSKLKISEDVVHELKQKLQDSDSLLNQFRGDMQRLNELYIDERNKHAETQNNYLRQEQALSHAQGELNFIQKEVQQSIDNKKIIKSMKSSMEKAQAAFEEQKNQLNKTIFVLEQQCKDQEKAKADLGSHVWNLSEEIKKLKGDIEAVDLDKKSLLNQIEQAKRNEQNLLDDKKNSIMAEQEAIEKIKTEHESTKLKNANLNADINYLRNSLSERESKIGQLDATIISLEDSLKLEKLSIQTQMNEFSNLLSVSKNKIADLESELKIAQDKVKSNDAKCDGILSKLAGKESALESLQFELVVFLKKKTLIINLIQSISL